MILVDTPIWIDHLNAVDHKLETALDSGNVVIHPFIIGEITLGRLRHRDIVLDQLRRLPTTEIANDGEVVQLIEHHTLFGSGIGYVDAHLLAATRLTPDATLWTRDKALRAAAERLGLAASF